MLAPMIVCVLFILLGGMFPAALQSFFAGIAKRPERCLLFVTK